MHKVHQRLLSGLLCLAMVAGFVPTIAAADNGEVPAETEAALIETVEAVIEETEATTVETTEVVVEEAETAAFETTEVVIEETEAATVETTAEIEEQSETIAAEEIVPAETAETVETVAVEDNSASPAESSDISSGTPDGTPPVLVSLELEKITVTAPGTIEVTAEATDDVSGVESVSVRFECEETGKSLHGYLESTYWDDENMERVPFADGKLHGTIKIDQYLESGVFTLDSINVYDEAGNSKGYISYYNSNYSSNFAPIPAQLQNLQIMVVEDDAPDGIPPVLVSLELEKTTVTAPGTIGVTAEATDDVSGVSDISVRFECEETGKSLHGYLDSTYWDDESMERVPFADGKLHGTIKIDQYLESGIFTLDSINVYDEAGNSKGYISYYNSNYSSNFAPIPEELKNLQITVVEGITPDGTPPVLVSLDLEKTTVTAPGTIEVTAEATDDVSGVESVSVRFECEETGKSLHGYLESTYWDDESMERVPFADGKLHGTIKIDQYLESGIFTLDSINVYDEAGNSTGYISYYNSNYSSNFAPIPEQLQSLTIQVINALPDVTTSVAKPEFLEEVKNAEEDAYIVADYSGNATVPEDVFDAISGTDKTLDLVSEGITWRFEGKDIVNDAKDIDLHVEIKPVEQDTSETGKDIQDALEEVPAVVMKFPENGTLPGKATIQVKVDYTMQEYLGTNRQLSVYYFNNQTGELELIASNLTVNGDSYVEFPITHCSYYILTVEPAAEKTEVIPVYRLYNPYTQEHLLTGGAEERDALISVGWSLDGVAWEAPKEGIPVYRLYNPYDDWHTYTTSESERDTMVTAGWTVDGAVSFGYTGKDGRSIYRLFNPYVQTNYHLFTAGTDERDLLVNAGWILEGTAWYSVK